MLDEWTEMVNDETNPHIHIFKIYALLFIITGPKWFKSCDMSPSTCWYYFYFFTSSNKAILLWIIILCQLKFDVHNLRWSEDIKYSIVSVCNYLAFNFSQV